MGYNDGNEDGSWLTVGYGVEGLLEGSREGIVVGLFDGCGDGLSDGK